MKHIALWGSSEHSSETDDSRLAARIESLGLVVERLPRGAPPPRHAHAIVINTKQDVCEAELAAMPQLELVITTTSGYDHIDLDRARARGVTVARCPLARRDAVAETSLAMGLALLRRVPEWTAHARRGNWVRSEVKQRRMPAIRDITVGVVGLGVIGSVAIARWRELGAHVVASDPLHPRLPTTGELLERVDILTLHCSLTETSRNLLNSESIQRMKRGAIVLNTARGECVDVHALADGLRSGQLGGLGLDVFTPEPPPELVDLATLDNVLLSPHSAGYFDGLNAAIDDEVVATLAAHLAKRPLPGRVH